MPNGWRRGWAAAVIVRRRRRMGRGLFLHVTAVILFRVLWACAGVQNDAMSGRDIVWAPVFEVSVFFGLCLCLVTPYFFFACFVSSVLSSFILSHFSSLFLPSLQFLLFSISSTQDLNLLPCLEEGKLFVEGSTSTLMSELWKTTSAASGPISEGEKWARCVMGIVEESLGPMSFRKQGERLEPQALPFSCLCS